MRLLIEILSVAFGASIVAAVILGTLDIAAEPFRRFKITRR